MPPPVKGQKCHPCVRNTVLPLPEEGHKCSIASWRYRAFHCVAQPDPDTQAITAIPTATTERPRNSPIVLPALSFEVATSVTSLAATPESTPLWTPASVSPAAIRGC